MMHLKTKQCSKPAVPFRQREFSNKDIHSLNMIHEFTLITASQVMHPLKIINVKKSAKTILNLFDIT